MTFLLYQFCNFFAKYFPLIQEEQSTNFKSIQNIFLIFFSFLKLLFYYKIKSTQI